MFSGNCHESVPRTLFFAHRLTPLECNAWQVIRPRLNDNGVTVFPAYEELHLLPFQCSEPRKRRMKLSRTP
jgi:hypothetical protein